MIKRIQVNKKRFAIKRYYYLADVPSNSIGHIETTFWDRERARWKWMATKMTMNKKEPKSKFQNEDKKQQCGPSEERK